MSERFACNVTGQNRSTYRRPGADSQSDADLREWLRIYSRENPGRGFRQAYRALRSQGWLVNHKKIQRLWREEELKVPQSARSDKAVERAPVGINHSDTLWDTGVHFVTTMSGNRVFITAVIDRNTRECVACVVDRGDICGRLLASRLRDVKAGGRSLPQMIYYDDNARWLRAALQLGVGSDVELLPIKQSSIGGSRALDVFRLAMHQECLSGNNFWSVATARRAVIQWVYQYNRRRGGIAAE